MISLCKPFIAKTTHALLSVYEVTAEECAVAVSVSQHLLFVKENKTAQSDFSFEIFRCLSVETLEASGWNLEFIWTLYQCKLSSICSVKSDVKAFIPSVCLYMFHSADPWLSSLYHLQGGIRGSWLTDRINPTVLKEAKRGIAQISAFHTIMRPFMFRENHYSGLRV